MREPSKLHEYEVTPKNQVGPHVFAGRSEQSAVLEATAMMTDPNHDAHHVFGTETHLRLYHTYPDAGPVRRYVGMIDRDGVLRRPA